MDQKKSIRGIDVVITRKKVKNLSLRVLPPDGEVKATVPQGMKEKQLNDFIASKEPWILKQKEKMALRVMDHRREYKDGEEHYLFGKKYTLRLQISASKQGVKVENNFIILYVKNAEDLASREKLLEDWYRHNLENNIPGLISKYEKLMGVQVKEFRIRKMTTRWGTCNPSKKRIWFSLMLAKRRPALVEYIVVHEMAHLLERGHNKRFYAIMDRYLPGWKELRKELK